MYTVILLATKIKARTAEGRWIKNPVWPSFCVTPAGTSNELDVQNGWEENTHTHTVCYLVRYCRKSSACFNELMQALLVLLYFILRIKYRHVWSYNVRGPSRVCRPCCKPIELCGNDHCRPLEVEIHSATACRCRRRFSPLKLESILCISFRRLKLHLF